MNRRSSTIVPATNNDLLIHESLADIHQPMHLGTARDNGGDDIEVGTE